MSRNPFRNFRRPRRARELAAVLLALACAGGVVAQQSADQLSPAAQGQQSLPHPPPPAVHWLPEQQQPSPRRHLVVRLPQTAESQSGEMIVRPNVRLSDGPPTAVQGNASAAFGATGDASRDSVQPGPEWLPLPSWTNYLGGFQPVFPLPEPNPDAMLLPETLEAPWPEMIDGSFQEGPHAPPEPKFAPLLNKLQKHTAKHPCGPVATLFGPQNWSGDKGIGHERVMLAPFQIDVSQPFNNYRLRVDNVYGFRTPDRAEYLWAQIGGRGPAFPEIATDYQDIRFSMELGGESFSVTTDVPLRILDPVINGNTAGLGDLNVTTKTVLLSGDRWQLTQLFRTYLSTGDAKRGLGTGHVSLEPGMLARYRWSDSLFVHSELKFWIPLGGDPVHSGEVLQYGIGTSHVLYETDAFAILDTWEFVASHVLDGQKTVFGIPGALPVDNDSIFHLYPGLRFVADSGGDLGLFELGICGSMGLGSANSRWFDGLLRIDLRWSY